MSGVTSGPPLHKHSDHLLLEDVMLLYPTCHRNGSETGFVHELGSDSKKKKK